MRELVDSLLSTEPGWHPADERLGPIAATCALARELVARMVGGAPAAVVERCHRTLQDLPVPLAVFEGPAHRLRLANAAWYAMFGPDAASAAGDRGIAGERDRLASELDRARASGIGRRVSSIAYRARRAGSSVERFYSAVIQPFDGGAEIGDGIGGGIGGGIVVAYADVTSERLARRLLVDLLPTLLWSGTIGAGADRYTQRWCDYTGLSRERAAETGWQHAVHPDDLPACAAAFEGAARGGVHGCEARLRGADGSYRWHVIRFTCPDAPRWFGAATDIDDVRSAQTEHRPLLTQARAARAEAERAHEIKDWLISAVSHELRAPLATIMLWEKAMRERPGVRDRALDAIHDSGVAQSRLIDDLIDISRAMNSTLRIDARPLAIADDLASAVERIRAAAAARSLAIEHRTGPGLGAVLGDVRRIRQILDTVLANAVRFSEPGGRILVTARNTGPAIEIAVADSGRGFASEAARRLVDPFGDDSDGQIHRAGTLGVGLAIAGRLVELHGGTLVASSQGVGLGATFTLTLPLASGSASTGSTVANPSPTANLDGVRVLVVEDSRDMREAVEVVLGAAGAVVGCVESAADAVTALASAAWDVVVSDLEMPSEDGYSLARRIRGGAATRGLPMVALTASAATADTERARGAGFDVHVAKPVDLDALVAGIVHAIAARRGPVT